MKKLTVFLVLIFALGSARPSLADGMEISSGAFSVEGNIPPKYTCDGANASPPLNWSGIPAKTESLALIMEDPDAPSGLWVHWVAYNIPSSARTLPLNVPTTALLPDGTQQGMNSFPTTGYGGPCPPLGDAPHRYFFKLYALDTKLTLPPTAGKAELEVAMEGHLLDRAVMMGHYKR